MKKSLLLFVGLMLTTLSALALPAKPTVTFTPWATGAAGTSAYYLYNVDAGLFLTGGNAYQTRAALADNGKKTEATYLDLFMGNAEAKGYKFEIGEEDNATDDEKGEVNCFSFENKTTSNFLSADDPAGIWVDGSGTRPYKQWFVEPNVGDNTFKLFYVNKGVFGAQKFAEGDGNTNTFLDKENYDNTTWALVSEDVYEEVIDQLNLYFISQGLNDLVTRGKAQGIEKDWTEYDNLLASDETTYEQYKTAVQALAPIVNLGDAIAEAKALDSTHDWSEFENVYSDPEATIEVANAALAKIKGFINLCKGLKAEDIDPSHNYDSFYDVYGNTDATTAELDSALTNLNAYKLLKANLDAAKADYPGINVTSVEAVYNQTMKTDAELAQAEKDLEAIITEYKLNNASVDNPSDVSEKIVNRTFDVIEDFHGWNGDGFGAGGTTSTNAEIYGKSFDTWQDIEGLPGGVYMVACKGYTRYKDAQSDYDAWKAGKVSETKVYLKSDTRGQFFSPVMHVSQDGSIDAPIGTYGTTSVKFKDAEEVEHTLYCPNYMITANDYFHEDPPTGGDPVHGRYYNQAFGPLAAGDVLRIGVFNKKATDSDWSIFDDFQLIYYGNGIDAYQYWGQKVVESYVVSFDNVYYGAPEREYYENIVASITTAETPEEISAAIEKLDNAVDSIQGSKDAYALYVEKCNAAAAWLAAPGVQHSEAEEVLKLTSYLDDYDDDMGAEDAAYFGFPNGVSNHVLNRVEGQFAGILCTKDIIAETAYVEEMYQDAIRNDLLPGTDLTDLIVNPGFEEAGGKGWSIDTHGGTCVKDITSWHGGSSTNWCAEAYEQKFDVYQVIEGVKDGIYEVSVQAFYRTAGNADAYTAYNEDPTMQGAAKVYSYVYFNEFATPVRNVMEIQYNENLANNCYETPAKTYTLNGMASASAAFSLPSEELNFTMKVYGLVTDGKIRLGIRNLEKDGGARWTLFDNFKLVYRGMDPTILADQLAALMETVQTFTDENADYMTSVEGDMVDDVVSAADDALSSGDAETLYKALSDLNAAYVDVQKHVAAFQELSDQLDALNSALADYETTASDAAIDEALAILDEDVSGSDAIDNMNTEEIEELTARIVSAIEALRIPKTDGASDDTPVDMTSTIVNPDIEEGATVGWSYTKNGGNGPNLDSGISGKSIEFWNGSASNLQFNIWQEIVNLPAGKYELTADASNSLNGQSDPGKGGRAFLYAATYVAEGDTTWCTSEPVEIQTENANEKWNNYSTIFTIEEGQKLTIGFKSWGTMDARWFVADNFTLKYFGTESAKEDSGDIWTGVDEFAVEAPAIIGIFSTAGVPQLSLQPGVNIVKYANGDVKKIQVKK